MSDISEEEWKKALIHILEELDNEQYRKVQFLLKIPKSEKIGKRREKIAQKLIEHFGLEGSISEVSAFMEEIPRKDEAVQKLLRPFLEKLRDKQEKENLGKRKRDPVEDDTSSEAGKKKKKCDPLKEPAADQQKSCPPEQERNAPPWKKSILDLKSSSELNDTDGIIGMVVQKSGLRTYKTKENVKRFFSYVAVADETGSIELMVYGKDRYKNIQEGKCYLFRRLIRDEVAVKVTALSKVSQTRSVEVSEELEMEARRLIYPESPVCSIKDAKSSAYGTKTVQGTVTEIDPVEQVTVQREQRKTKRQIVQLKDDTDSTRICMWGENAKQCKELSFGDLIKVTNLTTNQYHTSLSSTRFTQIIKVQSVGVQNERIEIMGIIKARKEETQLEAEFNQQVHTFVVASPLLAKAFGLKLDGDFKQSVLAVISRSAEAVIKGTRLHKLTATSKM